MGRVRSSFRRWGDILKYDDASWHCGGDFPNDLPDEAGATHIGMFVTWAVLNGLAGQIHTEDLPEALAKLQSRQDTPGAWFLQACDGKFTDEDLNEEGNQFARDYYADDAGLQTGVESYLADYDAVFADVDSLYRVPDTWESYEKVAPTIARRFMKWRNSKTGWRRLFS